jgi:two-component system response regulator DesR
VIHIMIVENMHLLRGALAAVLASESDLEVIAELAPDDNVLAIARTCRPDVVVIDVERCDPNGLALPRQIRGELPDCQILALTSQRSADALRHVLDAQIRGFLDKDTPPSQLVASVRRIAAGEWVIDPQLAVAALHPDDNPLTARQREVLRLAADGVPSSEIAQRLFLSAGTVRNYLSAAIRKIGAQNLLEAIHLARKSGWL